MHFPLSLQRTIKHSNCVVSGIASARSALLTFSQRNRQFYFPEIYVLLLNATIVLQLPLQITALARRVSANCSIDRYFSVLRANLTALIVTEFQGIATEIFGR